MRRDFGLFCTVLTKNINLSAIHLKPTILDFYEKRAEAFIQICDFRSAILNYRKILEWGNNQKIETKLAFLYYFYGQGKLKNYIVIVYMISQ